MKLKVVIPYQSISSVALAVGSFIILVSASNSAAEEARPHAVKHEAIAFSKERAVELARRQGLSGTTVEASLVGKAWHITARSKDNPPPSYFVISTDKGEIIFKSLNTETEPVPPKYLRATPTASYSVTEDKGRLIFTPLKK